MSTRIRVLLADDHAVLRSGLEALLALEDDVEVVGQAGTGEEAVEKTRLLRPDVVVMDLAMPEMDGLEATRRIAALALETHVLVLTSQTEEEYLVPVLEAGASGFVRKTSADVDLLQAIRTVAGGEVFLYPSATRVLLSKYQQAREPQNPGPLAKLSDREREVLTLTAEGYSSAEVGKKLFLSPKTVDTYRARMMQKLGLSHRAELVRLALETGMLKTN
ncbi:response regulator transcription factor [Longimicrobium terrae]|uniref:Two-component system response regulator NreC n=1 Tax=Longimicrobium terrae TaxID=1639882 RepID=A0A841GYI2_9BACT|nr:response regulator transcription factor [Longimicrobium terrae]MBB4636656.1 two-component system response regulator NreC [Longimicrobium terrae]MBB6070820.1 two-component system response regulator NreC [Longimicrobium terrae]